MTSALQQHAHAVTAPGRRPLPRWKSAAGLPPVRTERCFTCAVCADSAAQPSPQHSASPLLPRLEAAANARTLT